MEVISQKIGSSFMSRLSKIGFKLGSRGLRALRLIISSAPRLTTVSSAFTYVFFIFFPLTLLSDG